MSDHDVLVRSVMCAGDGARRPLGFRPSGSWELCLVRRGCFRYRSSRADVLVDATTGVFGLPGSEFEVTHPLPGGDADTFILLGAHALAAVAGGDLELPVAVRTTPWVDRAHRRLAVLAARQPSGAAVEELALLVVASLLAQVQPARTAAGLPHTERAGRYLVDDARAALTADPDLSVVRVAVLVGCSPHHLSRLFVRHTGAGIAAYRTAVRTARALDRLADGDGTLAQLAAACGFADHAHLSRTVRARFGTTPSALRAELGGMDGPGR